MFEGSNKLEGGEELWAFGTVSEVTGRKVVQSTSPLSP